MKVAAGKALAGKRSQCPNHFLLHRIDPAVEFPPTRVDPGPADAVGPVEPFVFGGSGEKGNPGAGLKHPWLLGGPEDAQKIHGDALSILCGNSHMHVDLGEAVPPEMQIVYRLEGACEPGALQGSFGRDVDPGASRGWTLAGQEGP